MTHTDLHFDLNRPCLQQLSSSPEKAPSQPETTFISMVKTYLYKANEMWNNKEAITTEQTPP